MSRTNSDGNDDIFCAINAYNNRYLHYFIINGSCLLPSAVSMQTILTGTPNAYYKLSNKLTLFRLVNGSNVLPYDFLTQTIKPSPFGMKDHNNYSLNFRSVVLDDWNNIRPAAMNVTIRNVDDVIVAWLYFDVKSSDTITSWFSLNNLIKSYPWDINILKGSVYLYFSILGDRGLMRSFSIYIQYANCLNDITVLVVFDALDYCKYNLNWLTTSIKYPQIFYVVDGNKPAGPDYFIYPGKSLEIIGTFQANTTIFG